jgi:hypothetical protein
MVGGIEFNQVDSILAGPLAFQIFINHGNDNA